MCISKEDEIKLKNYKELQRQYVRLLEDKSFRCPECFGKLHWESDINMSEHLDEEGFISFYHCCNCGIEVEVRRYDNPTKCSCEENYLDEDDI